jgi:hypothetical protein
MLSRTLPFLALLLAVDGLICYSRARAYRIDLGPQGIALQMGVIGRSIPMNTDDNKALIRRWGDFHSWIRLEDASPHHFDSVLPCEGGRWFYVDGDMIA